jgi:tRNA(adenine34) deaminase
MREALLLADRSKRQGEVPVGAVIVHDGHIVGRGRDTRETMNDPLAHAEIIAIREACARLDHWRLIGCTMYVTLEPCIMCMGAILHTRMTRIVYGATSPKWGAVESVLELANVPDLNHRVQVTSGICAEECSMVLSSFFEQLRGK